jgi:hypothetical protein
MNTSNLCENDRPSPMLINGLRNACVDCGYSGMTDPRFVEFVFLVVGVVDPRSLTRLQASVVMVEMILNLKGTSIHELPRAPSSQQ